MRLAVTGMLIKSALFFLRRLDRLRGTDTGMSAEEFRDNPYESFRRMRCRSPVVRSLTNQGWMVTGYREAQDILRDSGFSNDLHYNRFFINVLRVGMAGKPIPFIDNPTMLNLDPPDHTRLRKLVRTGFVNDYIQSLAPRIHQLVDELLAGAGPEFDLIETLAKPLPAMVIAEMLGVPEDENRFQQWSDELTGATLIGRPDLMQRASDAEQSMQAYIETLIEHKRARPGQDFVSTLIEAEEGGDRLTRAELVATCVLLLSAGHETTARLISNGMFTLLQHPAQLQMLRDDPGLMPGAIEEMLRYEPPIQMTIRFVSRRKDLHGFAFRQGQMVLVCVAGANRDPRQFPEPDRFDITRKDNRHLSFGFGIHLCLGMALARLEAGIVFSELLRRYDQISCLEDKPAWGINPFFRDLQQLRVRVT
jgi:pimeloyl-[acyl-carrier protein] synthase